MGSQFNTALWGGGSPAGTVAVTGTSLIYGALRLLGVLRPGQTPNTDSFSDGLAWLNELLDSWATERLMVKVVARIGITMTGATSYATLPHRIEAAGYVAAGATTEEPVEVYQPDRWRAISQRVQSGTPAGIYPEYTVAEATVSPYPQPASGELAIYQWQPLEAFADLETSYTLPAGYALALRYSLAEQIAPAFAIIQKIEVPQSTLDRIERKAREYKAAVKRLNIQPSLMECDSGVGAGRGSYDIRSGEYR